MTPRATPRTVLITGATDGIGRLAALQLAEAGHDLLLHGRDPDKLGDVEREALTAGAEGVSVHRADLSSFVETADLAGSVAARLEAGHLDAVVHNAGVYATDDPVTADGLDLRFVVNALAPYLLTRRLDRLLSDASRIVSVASAAQSPVDLDALRGEHTLQDGVAYAQSKLAMTMWTMHLARQPGAPALIAVNPSSLMATKMVREAFGVDGSDPGRGADILVRAAVGEDFADARGEWYDGDAGARGEFAEPHAHARDEQRSAELVAVMDELLAQHLPRRD